MSDVPFDPEEEEEEWEDPELRARTKCTIFLSYTSNLISSGIRETILFLVKHKMVSCIVTTGGGIEEDFIKCLAPTYLGNFALKGKDLREKGVNRYDIITDFEEFNVSFFLLNVVYITLTLLPK